MISIEILGNEKLNISSSVNDISFSNSVDLLNNKCSIKIQMFKNSIVNLFSNGDNFAMKGKQIFIKYLDRLLYWGFIDSININTSLDETGLEITDCTLSCDSIFTRLLNSEIIHANNVPLVGAISSEALSNYGAYLSQENDFGKILKYTLDNFSFAKAPLSLFDRDLRIVDMINVCDGSQNYFLPILDQYSDEKNKVISSLKQGLVNPNDKILTLQKFMTIFQQTPELVEFFFMLLPYQESYLIPKEKKVLYKQIGAIPTIILRYKPLPPKFTISKKSLEKVRDTRLISNPILNATYTEDTSDRSNIDYLKIPSHQILSVTQDFDSEPITAVSVYNGISDNNSSVAFTLADSLNHLIINEEDSRFLGISHKIITNFYIQDRSPLYSAQLTEFGWCLHGDGAYYTTGLLKLSLSFTQSLVCGVWCEFDLHGKLFTCYITQIEHKIMLSSSGIQEGYINVYFERGSYNRLPLFYPKQVTNDYPQNDTKKPINPIPPAQVSKRG